MPNEMTDSQRHVLSMLTDQRSANLLELVDLVGDMSADGLDVLRRLGSKDHVEMTNFLKNGKAETFEFLTEARAAEIKELENGIELVRAFRTTGKFAKWAIISLGATLAAGITIVKVWKSQW